MRKDIIIKVGGMSCVRCSAAVENALNAQKGVLECNVSYVNGRAEVSFEDSLTNQKSLEKAIKNAGYTVIQNPKEAAKKEFRNNLAAFVFSLTLSLPFFLMLVFNFTGTHCRFLHNGIFQLVLATPIQLLAGFRFYKGALYSLKNKSPSMDLLVALGTTASYVYSIYSLIANGIYGKFYFESSAMIITLVLLGKMLQSRARAKTGAAIEKLINLTPKTACVLRDGKEQIIPAAKIQKGDTLIIRPGESVPADGFVTKGESYLDESMLTGESMPVAKRAGDKVFGGTLNGNGALYICAEGIGEETLLSSIIRLVENAQGSKAHVQTVADKASAIFVPAVTIISAITFAATYFITKSITNALDSAVAVLVIACPCSLGLATPTALMVGMGRGAEMGILIKNADALEQACKIKALVLDKTGTITEGRPRVVNITPLNNTENALLYTATAEQFSQHPLAAVIAAAHKGDILPCTDFLAHSGNGISATVNGKSVLVGNPQWISAQCNTTLPKVVEELSGKGNTVVVSAIDNIPALAISVSDPIRNDSKPAVRKLNSLGIHTVLVTGDNSSAANAVAQQAGIDTVYANALPTRKVEILNSLKEQYGVTAMVGDGINDAPALACANVGFAIGNGTDIAMETGDIILTGGGISSLTNAILLSRATVRKIKQNLFWAFFYNTVGIPLAAFGMLNPVIAGAAMAFSSVSVVTNSLLLKRKKL
ncbi:MAG: copper-translocating P-type ATPase [Clostridia bacterium]|nr:copper-translocating P-type ATPase [Clostridia bacterium]